MAAVAAVLAPQAALAHDSVDNYGGSFWGPNPSFCVWGFVSQNHGNHYMATDTYGPNCQANLDRPPGWIAQAQQY